MANQNRTADPSIGLQSRSSTNVRVTSPRLVTGEATRENLQVLTGELTGTAPPRTGAFETDRDAVLRALYGDRSVLVDRDLLGTLSDDDRARLQEIERDIDRWEAIENRDVATRDQAVWEHLDKIARGTLELQAKIETLSSRGK
jgi:hypothetical protein